MRGSEPIPFEDRPTIPRNKLGPFINGYINGMRNTSRKRLGDWDKWDLDENLLAQIIRDCASFYWRNRVELELIWGPDEDKHWSKICGECFWLSRQGREGFSEQGFQAVWDKLHHDARNGFGKFFARIVRADGLITWAVPMKHKGHDPLKGEW
jgi:hypothetical protein